MCIRDRILKLVFFPTAGPAQTMIEVKQVSFTAPPASVFIVPASCTLPGPTLPEDERILAETGGPAAADFVNATTAPVSANSCTVLYRVVQARSMRPVTTGFQVAIDKTVDVNHPASYTTVSYTHLDVYKRQPLRRAPGIPRLRRAAPDRG